MTRFRMLAQELQREQWYSNKCDNLCSALASLLVIHIQIPQDKSVLTDNTIGGKRSIRAASEKFSSSFVKNGNDSNNIF